MLEPRSLLECERSISKLVFGPLRRQEQCPAGFKSSWTSGGFDCEIVISQEPDVDFEMVDLNVFDQIRMNESKVVLTIIFVPLIMFALLILLEGFKK